MPPAAERGAIPHETVTVKPAQAGSVRYAECCAWVFAITEAELQCCFHCARLPDGGRALFLFLRRAHALKYINHTRKDDSSV